MSYKVCVVTTKSGSCCTPAPELDEEVERTCNHLGERGWVLVSAYPENVRECNNVKRAAFLIFARPEE
jgi:hypothetical protein